MSTTTLHGIPSSNYWQSHHPYLRMYRVLIIIVVVINSIITASLASQLQYIIMSSGVARSEKPISRHCPVWMCKYYPVFLGPFSKHFLFSDKPMASIWGMFMKKIFITLISSLFIVMVGDFSISFCPRKEKKKERKIEMKNEAFIYKNTLYAQELHLLANLCMILVHELS